MLRLGVRSSLLHYSIFSAPHQTHLGRAPLSLDAAPYLFAGRPPPLFVPCILLRYLPNLVAVRSLSWILLSQGESLDTWPRN